MGIGALIGLGSLVTFFLILCLIGFACSGVRNGSAAAGMQSSIGDVSPGSCFSCCQSLGAGYFILGLIIGSAIIGALCGLAYFIIEVVPDR